jgi:7-keto-8-aminopelargonate synthetase-like enzyme
MVLDRLAHACLVDGARLSGARVRSFRHNDAADLASTLEKERSRAKDGRLLVVIESLYSMDGDVAPLADIYEEARRFDAWLMVDEAHATGVLGPNGRGVLADVFPGSLPEDVLAMGTLSKALGSQGGYLCATRRVIDLLVNAGRAFLFSTGLAPAAAAAAREALCLLEEDDGPRRRLLERSDALRARLQDAGWSVPGGPGPILPLMVGDERRATEIADRLLEQGFWVPAIRYPTVKRGAARLRLSLSSAHGENEIHALADALKKLR